MGGVALYVSAVVGPGILTLPAAAAQIAGPLSLAALAALLAVSVPAAFAFVHIHQASVQRGRTASAGLQRYATLAFGEVVGRVVAAWFYVGVPIGVPALALIGGSYISAATGGGRPVTVAVAWAVTAVTFAIVAGSARANGGLSLALAIALVLLILGAAAVSMPEWRPGRLRDIAPHGALALIPAALTLAWVLMGWEASTNFTSMLRDPDRRLPRVIAISLAVVVLLYAAVAIPELLVLGPFAGSTSAPVAAVLRAAVGPPASLVAAVLAVVLTLATSVAYLTSFRELGRSLLPATPRLTGSRRNLLALAVPAVIAAIGLLIATVAPVDAGWFVRVCAGSQIPVYLVALGSGLVLLRRGTHGWWLALLASAAVAVLLVAAGPYLLVPAAIAACVFAARFRPRAQGTRRRTAGVGGAVPEEPEG